MTNEELLAFVQTPEFNIENYAPVETDTMQEAQAKIDFLTQVASLADDETLTKPEPVSCMVNCVIAYLQCGNTAPCWILLQNCVGNCQV